MGDKETLEVMKYEEDLGRLEQYLEKMLAGYNDLKRKKEELQASLRQKEAENIKLQEQIGGLRENRNIIRDRVTGLIGRIEEWERAQTEAGNLAARPENIEKSDTAEKSSQLFATGIALENNESLMGKG